MTNKQNIWHSFLLGTGLTIIISLVEILRYGVLGFKKIFLNPLSFAPWWFKVWFVSGIVFFGVLTGLRQSPSGDKLK